MRMKRNTLYIVAVFLFIGMAIVLASSHVFDERKKQATPVRKVERVLPKLPKWH